MLMARFDETLLQEGVPVTVLDAIKAGLTEPPTDFPCPNCGRHNCDTTKHYLVETPTVLLVHLNRVARDRRKINEPIDFEEYLTLPQELYSEPEEDIPPTTYRLYAVVYHVGNPSTGRYYSSVRAQGRHWKLIRNNIVEDKSFEDISRDKDKRTAYVLAYELLTDPVPQQTDEPVAADDDWLDLIHDEPQDGPQDQQEGENEGQGEEGGGEGGGEEGGEEGE